MKLILHKKSMHVVPANREIQKLENVEIVLSISLIDESPDHDERYDYKIMTHQTSPKIPYVGTLDQSERVQLSHKKFIRATYFFDYVSSTVTKPKIRVVPGELSETKSFLFHVFKNEQTNC
jgi:hypothetical protein